MKAKALDLKGAEKICTDPKDPQFFEGTTLEKKLSTLRHVAPEKFAALDMLVLEALRDEFLKLGPDPREARKGVY